MSNRTDYHLSEPFKPIHELVRQWALDTCDGELPGTYSSADEYIDNIENKRRDGFIPWTEGGVEIVWPALMDHCHSSGCVPDAIQPYLDSAIKDCDEEWDRLNPENTVEWLYRELPEQSDLFDRKAAEKEVDRWKEKYWEHSDAWLREGGTFFWKVRALYYAPGNSSNETGEPEVLFCVGINTDFEYGRDSIPWLSCYGQKTAQTQWLWEKTVKVSEITPELIKTLVDEAQKGLGGA